MSLTRHCKDSNLHGPVGNTSEVLCKAGLTFYSEQPSFVYLENSYLLNGSPSKCLKSKFGAKGLQNLSRSLVWRSPLRFPAQASNSEHVKSQKSQKKLLLKKPPDESVMIQPSSQQVNTHHNWYGRMTPIKIVRKFCSTKHFEKCDLRMSS